MQKSKIEWCDYTWSPITGCLHGCEYCYARGIAHRFRDKLWDNNKQHYAPDALLDLHYKGGGPYPAGFQPTFHRYRLAEPAKLKKPQNIFVCSMADLFGDWVPDEWIKEVFKACEAAPQHRYLFLTKNPERYMSLSQKGILPDANSFWYGSTITTPDDVYYYNKVGGGTLGRFLSIEPLLEPFDPIGKVWTDWVIIGAMTGPGSKTHQPKREWIESIVLHCRATNVPVFMKNSLIPIMGEENMLREYPW